MAKQKFQFQLPTASATEQVIEDSPKVSSIVQKLEEKSSPKSLMDEYKIIPLRKIRANKKNRYPIDEIEKLEESILNFGLQQDPSVIYIFDEDIYTIEAGHKRFTAICNLISRYQDYENTESKEYQLYLKNVAKYEHGLHCKVAGTIKENVTYDYDLDADLSSIDESVIDSEIRLIITNEEARAITPAVRAENIQRLSQLYERKNLTRKTNKININETIAEQLNITPRQVINYKNTDNLIPELKTLFNQNKIGLKVATSISKLDEDVQRDFFELFQNTEMSSTELKSLLDEKKTLQKSIKAMEQEITDLKSVQPSIENEKRVRELENQIAHLKQTRNTETGSHDPELIKSLSLNSQINTLLSQLSSIYSELQSLLPEYEQYYNNLNSPITEQLISPDEIIKKLHLMEEIQ